MPLVWTPCKAKEAQAVYCLNCEKVLEPCPYWGLRQTRGLHKGGTGHSVEYVKLEEDKP